MRSILANRNLTNNKTINAKVISHAHGVNEKENFEMVGNKDGCILKTKNSVFCHFVTKSHL